MSGHPRVIEPAEIHRRALALWTRGRALRAWMGVEALFPWSLPAGPPKSGRLLQDFAAVRDWKQRIEQQCACHGQAQGQGGYRIEYREINHRQLGVQRLPARLVFESLDELLAYLGKQAEFARFVRLSRALRQAHPALAPWIAQRPMQVLEYQSQWPRLLAVLDWFLAHPRPMRYLRELEISAVDSKFIEAHRPILSELLDRLLPAQAIDLDTTGLAHHGFERRYGLRYDQPLIRLRLLDPALAAHYGGLTDLSLPRDQFLTLEPPCGRVFITENKTNGLSFPAQADALVIFGLGYGVKGLAEAAWLHQRELYYWGDIDTHGFAILARLRAQLPQVHSLLMDQRTLEHHRASWVREASPQAEAGIEAHLHEAEARLYRALLENQWGEGVRLEQERVGYAWLEEALQTIGDRPRFSAKPTASKVPSR